jgi:hypothetical protein
MRKIVCISFCFVLFNMIFNNLCLANNIDNSGIDTSSGLKHEREKNIKMPKFYIPKEPDFPKFPEFKTLKFHIEVVDSHGKKIGKPGVDALKGVPPIPKSWVFSKSFKMSEEGGLIKYYKQIKSLGAPVFIINCKKDKDHLELQLGPYFDSDPTKVMHGYIVKIRNASFISFMKKMSVENYNPKKCNFYNIG